MLPFSLLAECPHGVPSLEGAVDRNGSPMFYLNSFSAVGPQGLLPSHSIIMQSARGVSGARPSGWVSKSLWLYPFPLLIPESTPCATPIQGEIIPGCNGGLKGKRLCYSSQLLHGPLEHALCLPGCLGLNCDQVVCAAPPPGLG